MVKSSPERLAQALRANLQRRKEGPKGAKSPEDGRAAKRAQETAPKPPEPAPKPAAQSPQKSPKTSS